MKRILSKLLGGALLFGLTMSLTSCDPYLDDIFGEWSRPTPGNNTSGGGSTATVASLTITDEPLRLEKATPQAIAFTVDPVDATITWTSDNEAVATVDASGKVTPKKAGTVTIKATAGDKTATSTVYVYDKIVDISTDISVDAGESWLINGTGTTEAKSITIAEGSKVTLNGINITKSINCTDNATIILADGSTNTVTVSTDDQAGIIVGGSGKTLTINAETAGTGTLTAKGGAGGAGIGTNGSGTYTCGDITISGGTVNATGGDGAAGIGNGFVDDYTYTVTCGNITIGAGVTSVTACGSSPIGKGSIDPVEGGTQVCGTITFGSAQVFDGTNWSPATMVAGTYGGLKLAISGNTWTLTPAP